MPKPVSSISRQGTLDVQRMLEAAGAAAHRWRAPQTCSSTSGRSILLSRFNQTRSVAPLSLAASPQKPEQHVLRRAAAAGRSCGRPRHDGAGCSPDGGRRPPGSRWVSLGPLAQLPGLLAWSRCPLIHPTAPISDSSHPAAAPAAPRQQQRRQGGAAARAPVRTAAATGEAYVGSLIGTGMKFGVVVGRFNDLVTKLLLDGALDAFNRHGVARDDVDVSGCACLPSGQSNAWLGIDRQSKSNCQSAHTGAAVQLPAHSLLHALAAVYPCPFCSGARLSTCPSSAPACLALLTCAAHCVLPPLFVSPQVAWVPGSFELPVVAKAMAKSGEYDAVVCIGVVVSAAGLGRGCVGGHWAR